MARVLGGYRDNASQKGSGLAEVTVTEVEEKAYLDVNVLDTGEISEEELDYVQMDQAQLLGDILKQLKIMNLHLSILTDNTIKKTEVE